MTKTKRYQGVDQKWRSNPSGANTNKPLQKPESDQNTNMNEILLKDFKDILEHAKEKGDLELADKLQPKYNELENIVTQAKSASASENRDSGVELDDNCIKFKDEGTSTTMLYSKWRKLGPSDFLPDNRPVSKYNETIMEINDEKLHKATRQLASINTLKVKRQVGFGLTPNQVDKVSNETDVTDEILQTIFKKKFAGLHYTSSCQQDLPGIRKRGGAALMLMLRTKYYPYTGGVNGMLLEGQKCRGRKLMKHISDIRISKKDLGNGETLSAEQLDKVNREDEILQEIAEQYTGLQFI